MNAVRDLSKGNGELGIFEFSHSHLCALDSLLLITEKLSALQYLTFDKIVPLSNF